MKGTKSVPNKPKTVEHELAVTKHALEMVTKEAKDTKKTLSGVLSYAIDHLDHDQVVRLISSPVGKYRADATALRLIWELAESSHQITRGELEDIIFGKIFDNGNIKALLTLIEVTGGLVFTEEPSFFECHGCHNLPFYRVLADNIENGTIHMSVSQRWKLFTSFVTRLPSKTKDIIRMSNLVPDTYSRWDSEAKTDLNRVLWLVSPKVVDHLFEKEWPVNLDAVLGYVIYHDTYKDKSKGSLIKYLIYNGATLCIGDTSDLFTPDRVNSSDECLVRLNFVVDNKLIVTKRPPISKEGIEFLFTKAHTAKLIKKALSLIKKPGTLQIICNAFERARRTSNNWRLSSDNVVYTTTTSFFKLHSSAVLARWLLEDIACPNVHEILRNVYAKKRKPRRKKNDERRNANNPDVQTKES